MIRTLIIDDEAPARADLRGLLGAHANVRINGEAALMPDARALLQGGDYDLVFMDVQLLGGTGFDLVPDVRPAARIIFVTAHDQFAFRAFEVNAIDYLQKPVRTARLAEALRRVERALPVATAPLRADDIVHVKTAPGAARFVPVAEIAVITSQDNYSEIALASGARLFVRQTMAAWETRLPATHFLRVHRRAIVNVARIESYAHHDEEVTLLRVAGQREPVRARREHWSKLGERLGALGVKV
ncbi:MAG TPA: LytTR family DNA-binding domain-containing protein [Opitutaceae bacterium]|nr:LytTR family DNA-binding domain-containing protein [Opitutaceae bacterium]